MSSSSSSPEGLSPRLAGRVAHDLNNISAVLSGHVFLLRSAEEPAEEAFEAMEKALEQLQRLTRSLATLAAVGLDEPQAFDVNDVARAAAAARHAGSVLLDLQSPLPRVEGWCEDVRRAVDALLENAGEAAGATRQVRLSTRREPDRAAVTIVVEDAGPGVPPSIRDRIFEPLVSDKGERGRGIGLTFAAMVAAMHGGSCALEDRPEGGARATLRLATGGRA